MTNIVYIHTHDTGRVLSPYGHATPTPQLQAWFEDAITFEQAYSVAPTCSPSRAGLLTGMYPHQNGMLGLAQRGFELDTSKHLARFLSENGYRTALCGVQHEYAYYLDHDLAYAELGYAEDLSADHRGYAESDLVYWDAENADNLSRWLVQNAGDDTPFFVSFGMHATHRAFPTAEFPAPFPASPVPPASVPNDAASRADYAGYLTSAKFADDAVGRVLTALKAAGRYDDTIVLVTTDHGIPYPGHKGTLTAAGTGVMLGVRVPGAAHGRGEYDGLISQIDIFPTLCDLVGLPAPEHLEGRSFAPCSATASTPAMRRCSPRRTSTPPTSRPAASGQRGGTTSGTSIRAGRGSTSPTSTAHPPRISRWKRAWPSGSSRWSSSTT